MKNRGTRKRLIKPSSRRRNRFNQQELLALSSDSSRCTMFCKFPSSEEDQVLLMIIPIDGILSKRCSLRRLRTENRFINSIQQSVQSNRKFDGATGRENLHPFVNPFRLIVDCLNIAIRVSGRVLDDRFCSAPCCSIDEAE